MHTDEPILATEREPEPFYRIDENGQVCWSEEGQARYRTWFGHFGLRLETIQTAEDLRQARRVCAPGFNDHLLNIASNGPRSLERNLLVAVAQGDQAEYRRLMTLLEARNRLGLQVIHQRRES